MILATRCDIGERYSGREILKQGRVFIAPKYTESLSDSTRKLRKPFTVALYTKMGVTMDRIAEGFHSIGLPMSTKTVSTWVGRERIRGFDPLHNKQTYHWTKFLGKYRRWAVGKITGALGKLFSLFLSWVLYYRETGVFDLDALMAGEKPP